MWLYKIGFLINLLRPEVTFSRCSNRWMFKISVPKISQILQENACVAVSFFKKVADFQPANLGTGVFLWLLENL